jgi:hypothetical protein
MNSSNKLNHIDALIKETNLNFIIDGAFHFKDLRNPEKDEIIIASDILLSKNNSKCFLIVKKKDLEKYVSINKTNHIHEILNSDESKLYLDIDNKNIHKFVPRMAKIYTETFVEKAFGIIPKNIQIYKTYQSDDNLITRYHILVPDIKIKRSEMQELIRKYDFLEIFDYKVYKKFQLFRIIGCLKDNKNKKEYISDIDTKNSSKTKKKLFDHMIGFY